MSKSHSHSKLSELPATAISGNDILSSVLYVSGIAALFAGVFAPLVILIIGIVLYFYKSVYTEAVEALPVNGGAYNCLLNASSKVLASVAGSMTILSYIATAVISAKVAIEYVHSLIQVPVIPLTIGLLFVFALLVISGIKDSANVAIGIFAAHILTLTIFLFLGIWYIVTHGMGTFQANYIETTQLIVQNGGIVKTLFFAFAVSLLGVSGFESSANFVEEQKRGVFRKTLRNMLIGVAFFSPIVAFLVLNSLPFETIISASDFLLAYAAEVIGGTVFKYWLVIDAFLVLSGAVLTAYVGASGLINRMAADDCLPGTLSYQNKKGAYPRIIITFFILCSSILVMTGGNLLSLAGVYTISFLGVMTLFAMGNLMLRRTRTELKRTYKAPLLYVILAGTATSAGIVGNILIEPKNFVFFLTYFVPTMLLVLSIIYKEYILRAFMKFLKPFPSLQNKVYRTFDDAIDGNFVVFIRNTERLFTALNYLNNNEVGRNIFIVVCDEPKDSNQESAYREIKESLPLLQKAGVFPHLKLKLIHKKEVFGPKVVKSVSKELGIPRNRVLIGSIHHHHDFDYDDFGGVRIVF